MDFVRIAAKDNICVNSSQTQYRYMSNYVLAFLVLAARQKGYGRAVRMDHLSLILYHY